MTSENCTGGRSAMIAVLGIALGCGSSSAPAPVPGSTRFCQYEPSTLAATTDEFRGAALRSSTLSALQPIPQRQVEVVYTGRSRAGGRWASELMFAYAMVARVGRVFDYYRYDLQVLEGGQEHWLRVHDQIRATIRRLGSPPDTIVAYVDLVGARIDRDTTRWLFVLRDYESRDESRRWREALCGAGNRVFE